MQFRGTTIIGVKKDDKIVISIMEHHSNLVPWQFERHLLLHKMFALVKLLKT